MSAPISRRRFLAGSGGLVLAFTLTRAGKAAAGAAPPANLESGGFLRIGEDSSVTLFIPEAEMGQGIVTSFAMIVADELGVPLDRVRTEFAPVDEKSFGRQITGGSRSIRTRYKSLRDAGAAARQLLLAAAGAEWSVDPAACRIDGGKVAGPEGKSSTLGALARRASKLPAPAQPAWKPDAQLALIGHPTPRLDTPAKVRGEATYGIDVRLPGLLTAVVERSPSFGGEVKRFDAAKAKAVPGVRQVVQIPSGVAVIADHFWAARTGREALEVEWNEPNASLSSEGISAELARLAPSGAEAAKRGDPDRALADAKQRLEATYEVPYLAHAPMEPLNATADVKADRCEIWAPTQAPGMVRDSAARICGFPPERIQVHPTFLGGGFGRKANTDYTDEAVHCSKKAGKPVQVVYTREDDMAAAQYRPAAYSRFLGALDAQGWPVAWVHQIASPSILASMARSKPAPGRIDGTSVEGAANLPYAIPNLRVTYAAADIPIPVWFWRSVGSSINTYVTECFFDELARLGGKDPLQARLRLLGEHPRHARVLQVAAEKIGWGKPAPSGTGRGIAVAECFGSIVAQAAEVTLEGDAPRVLRVTCALDCGKVVNPSTIVAQMESGIVYGLTAALQGRITIEAGRPVQRTFYDYPVLRMAAMPRIDTVVIQSDEAHGGVGELGTPPAAPAMINGLLALTGKPVRKLPIS
ncbi:MAG TPA: molybdopterin cofactor-binding domain-containing protein [Myxococcaceae bacterium]|jgi:isoquinoline 1-oxidoreductase beta subunit